ncbi:MAG: prephenate dehydratase [Muribaculaceae bacterium]
MKRVTIQGEAGCFHDATAHEYFSGEEIETIACASFAEMFEVLHGNDTLIGTLAIENTIAGSLLQNHELLRQSDLCIIGEYKKYISQSLAALPGQTINDINEVVSHPIALMQCEEYLKQHPKMKMVEGYDTAGCAKQIAQQHQMHTAAICGTYAARLYGLNVLAEDIQTNKRNFTRFLILAHPQHAKALKAGKPVNKASLAFTLPHEGGSLSKVLTILSFYDLNLTKIQSLPIIGHEWEYRFYIDLTFTDYLRYRQSIEAVIPLINDFKILGEYAEFNG